MRDVWQCAFDEEMDRSDDPLLANKVADDTVADLSSRLIDDAYDHWRDMEA